MEKAFHNKFITNGVKFLKNYITATRDDENTDYSPPYNDITASEIMFQYIMSNKNLLTKDYLTYLRVKEVFFFKK